MTRIKKLTVANYKSLQNIELELNNLNILIGRNGSGKSNLLNFFRLLHEGAKGNLTSHISQQGGFGEIRWRGSDDYDDISWSLIFEGLSEESLPIYYEGVLASRGNSFSVKSEELSRDPYNPGRYSDRFKFLLVSDGYIRILSPKRGESEENDEQNIGNDQEFAISQIRDPRRYPVMDEIQQLLRDWSIFRGFGEDALKEIYKAQSLDVSFPLRLDPHGTNLVSILQSLPNDPLYSDAIASLNEILETAFPDFEKLDLRPVGSNTIELRWRSKDFPGKPAFLTRSMSDGMLRFIGLAVLLLLPDPPSLIVIDEPEIGLHPGLIPILADLLKQASERTQLIITTHSPLLLNDVDLSDIVLVDRKDGATYMERADSRANLERWLERYRLGQLWTMGKLGG